MGRSIGTSLKLGALALGLMVVQGPLMAQNLPFELPPLIPNQAVSIDDVPGVPDARGCVKDCFRDDSPCDPPIFKHADNRCRNLDKR